MSMGVTLVAWSVLWTAAAETPPTGDATSASTLEKEVARKGWIAFSARDENGPWDIFLSRPDGSALRNVTKTSDREEAAPLFSPEGKQMLFRRIEKGATIDHDLWGVQGRLVVARADGSDPVELGGDEEHSWASWSPDSKRLACLTRKGIQIIDVATKAVVRTLPRKGIYQQLVWSPDGRWFAGTANHAGREWCVVRMDTETGDLNPIIRFQSCTPDWFPSSRRVIFSARPAAQSSTSSYGWTQLYAAEGDGKSLELVYGEDGVHVYGGSLSPDSAYVVFTVCPQDGGGSEKDGAPICLMRMADAPTIGGASPDLRRKHPKTKDGPVLKLHRGWEPCWTFAEMGDTR